MSEYDKLKNPDGSVAKALSATERLKVWRGMGASYSQGVAKALSATERLKDADCIGLIPPHCSVAKALSATERLKVPGCPGGPCGPGGVAKALSATERLKVYIYRS